jgi:hypothetical protein
MQALDIIAATARVDVTINLPVFPVTTPTFAKQVALGLVSAGWIQTSDSMPAGDYYVLKSQQSPWNYGLSSPPSDYIGQCLIYLQGNGTPNLSVWASNLSGSATQSTPILLVNGKLSGEIFTQYTYRLLATAFSFTLFAIGIFFESRQTAMMAGIPYLPDFQQARINQNSPGVQDAIYCLDITGWRGSLGSPVGPQFCCYQSKYSINGPSFWTQVPGGNGAEDGLQILTMDSVQGPTNTNLFFDNVLPSTFSDPTTWAPMFTPIRVMWGTSLGSPPTMKGFLFDMVYCSKPYPGDSQIFVDVNPTLVMNVFTNNNVGQYYPWVNPGTILICSKGGVYS